MTQNCLLAFSQNIRAITKNDKLNNNKNTVVHSKKYSKQIQKTNDKLGRIFATHNPDKGLISFINK